MNMARKSRKKITEERVIALIAVVFALAALVLLLSPQKESGGEVFYTVPAAQNFGGKAVFLPASFIKGDVDANSVVDAFDLSTLQLAMEKKLALDEYYAVRADLNNDGDITDEDFEILKDYLTGKISRLPAIRGDINRDRKVDGDDLLMLAEFLEGFRTFTLDELYLADMNRDGQVDEFDKRILIEKVRG